MKPETQELAVEVHTLMHVGRTSSFRLGMPIVPWPDVNRNHLTAVVCVCVCVCVCVRERERERERERGNFAGYRGNPATFFENTGTRFLVPFWAPKFSDSRNSAKFRGCSEIVRFLVPDPLVFS